MLVDWVLGNYSALTIEKYFFFVNTEPHIIGPGKRPGTSDIAPDGSPAVFTR